MKLFNQLAAAATAVLSTLVFAAAAIGYSGQVAGQVLVSGPDFVVACGYDWSLSAKVLESGTGNPIEDQPVQWAIVSSADPTEILSETETVTDTNGSTGTTMRVNCVYGERVVEARADDVTGRFTLYVQENGLPPTSVASLADSLPIASFSWMWLAAAGAVVAGFGIIGLRYARR